MGPIDGVRTLDMSSLGNEISDEEPQKVKCTAAIKSGTNPGVYCSVAGIECENHAPAPGSTPIVPSSWAGSYR
jgi:hypothetical protein